MKSSDTEQTLGLGRPNAWDRIELIFFLTITFVSLAVHGLTFIGYDPRDLSSVLWYALQFGSALSLIIALCVFGLTKRHDPAPISRSVDKVLGLLFILFLFYAAFNFIFTSEALLHGGSLDIVDSQYLIGSHGHFTEISKEEYMRYMVYEARMNSGHWMAAYFCAIASLRRRKRMPG